MPLKPESNILIYDEECFFCSNYVRLVNLKAVIGDITLINARQREKVIALGFDPRDLNEGFILILAGKIYKGADAIHRIALLSTSSGPFNRLNRAVFGSPVFSAALYPLLKLGRRLYLFLAGKKLIE